MIAPKSQITKKVLLVTTAALILAGCNLKTGSECLINGNEYFKAGDYDKAELEYREAVKLEPKSPVAYNNLGVILVERKKYDEAVEVLEKAIAQDPRNSIAHYVLANALLKLKRYPEARVNALKAVELDSSELAAHKSLAEATLAEGDAQTAVKEFRYLSEREPDDDDIRHKLGLALGMLGLYDAQIGAEKKALELNPKNTEAKVGMAHALMSQGKVSEAKAILEDVLQFEPGNEAAKSGLESIKTGNFPVNKATESSKNGHVPKEGTEKEPSLKNGKRDGTAK